MPSSCAAFVKLAKRAAASKAVRAVRGGSFRLRLAKRRRPLLSMFTQSGFAPAPPPFRPHHRDDSHYTKLCQGGPFVALSRVRLGLNDLLMINEANDVPGRFTLHFRP